jgi:hypothetical protein
VSLTGPLITFHGLPHIWAFAEILFLILALICLGLTCLTDPGFIERSSARDPLLDKLYELERAQTEHAVALTIKVRHEGVEYKRLLLNGAWQRVEPGAAPPVDKVLVSVRQYALPV